MPIFEYRCKECGLMVEKILRNPHPEIPCPECGKPAIRTVSLTSTTVSGSVACSTPAGSGFT